MDFLSVMVDTHIPGQVNPESGESAMVTGLYGFTYPLVTLSNLQLLASSHVTHGTYNLCVLA